MLNCEKEDCRIGGVESYVEEKCMKATWEFYKDDEEMLGSPLFGFAIAVWQQNHREEVEGFRKEYLKKYKKSC